ncbi:peptidase [Streptomyces sp. A012304]|uniref:peptidase n=1 Tax=Streptomyces sp. A012304 TaxID=375446 RepID=UPI0022306D11|nr:peptidase [Streptomyces sp. A012304]
MYTSGRTPATPPHSSLDLSGATGVPLQAPLVLAGLLVVGALSQALPRGADLALVGVWLASGALVFPRPVARLLARVCARARPATAPELAVLRPAFDQVTGRAGVDGSRYELWVAKSGQLTAPAVPFPVVGVTRAALEKVPAEQLPALLAQSLGRSAHGLPWVASLGFWYALPARVLTGIVTLVVSLVVVFTARVALLAVLLLTAISAALGVVAVTYFPSALALYAVPFLVIRAGRRGELVADRFAGRLGYGPLLTAVFQNWQAQGQGQAQGQPAQAAPQPSAAPVQGQQTSAPQPAEGTQGPHGPQEPQHQQGRQTPQGQQDRQDTPGELHPPARTAPVPPSLADRLCAARPPLSRRVRALATFIA